MHRAVGLGAPGSMVLVDNVVRDRQVVEQAADGSRARCTRDTLHWVVSQPQLEAAAI